MTEKTPTVLFLDDNSEALNLILQRVEPVFTVFSLHSPGPLLRYVERIRPHVVVISDQLKCGSRGVGSVVASLRERYEGAILILMNRLEEREALLWHERGASECALHPTRIGERVEELTRKIFDLATWESRPRSG